MTLAIGDKLPAFSAHTAEGTITDKDMLGQTTVIYFYPKDDTPGCTTEACNFRDTLPQFKRVKARVFGVSRDTLKKHDAFSRKYELTFPLISDEDGTMCAAFDVWKEKSMYGRKYMGIERATFLIDAAGIIQGIWRNVKVTGHVDEVIEKLKNTK